MAEAKVKREFTPIEGVTLKLDGREAENLLDCLDELVDSGARYKGHVHEVLEQALRGR